MRLIRSRALVGFGVVVTDCVGRNEADLAEPTVEKASSAGDVPANLSFAQSDLLSYEGGKDYDVLIMVRSLHHVFPLDQAVNKIHSLLKTGGTLIADEFAREAPNETAAKFLFDRIDLLRVAVPASARVEGGGHSHGHTHGQGGHGGESGGSHSHGGQEKAHSLSAGHSHSYGGHGDHSHASHDREHDHDNETPAAPAPATEEPGNLSYVHGQGTHVGVRDDGLPREGTPEMPPLERWQRVIKHDPPLPSSEIMVAELQKVFGEANLKVESNRPAMYLMAAMRLAPEVAAGVAKVVHTQETKAIAEGQFKGIGLIFTAKKA